MENEQSEQNPPNGGSNLVLKIVIGVIVLVVVVPMLAAVALIFMMIAVGSSLSGTFDTVKSGMDEAERAPIEAPDNRLFLP